MNRGGSNYSGKPDKEFEIKNSDMSKEMEDDAVELALAMLRDKQNKPLEKDIAAELKKEFDTKHEPTWHCIVGRNYGSHVTHEKNHFIYFYVGRTAILLFKSG
nr:dynein light chain 1, cytoplasmic-like [Lytechinus pictus]